MLLHIAFGVCPEEKGNGRAKQRFWREDILEAAFCGETRPIRWQPNYIYLEDVWRDSGV